jgi:hypothetical protein
MSAWYEGIPMATPFGKVGQLILRVAFFVAVAPHAWRPIADYALVFGYVDARLDWSEVIDFDKAASRWCGNFRACRGIGAAAAF